MVNHLNILPILIENNIKVTEKNLKHCLYWNMMVSNKNENKKEIDENTYPRIIQNYKNLFKIIGFENMIQYQDYFKQDLRIPNDYEYKFSDLIFLPIFNINMVERFSAYLK